MTASVLVCSYGDHAWSELAWSRAYPSCMEQGAHEVLVEHDDEMYLDEVRNSTAREATGEWLVFLDADDELAPGYLDAMLDAVASLTRCAALLVPQVSYVSSQGETPPCFPNRRHPFTRMNHAVIGTMLPRWLFDKVGGFHSEPVYEDWALWLRCLREGAELVYVHDAVYRAFVRSGSRNEPSAQVKADTYDSIRREHFGAEWDVE